MQKSKKLATQPGGCGLLVLKPEEAVQQGRGLQTQEERL